MRLRKDDYDMRMRMEEVNARWFRIRLRKDDQDMRMRMEEVNA
jgi:hypothetical protein